MNKQVELLSENLPESLDALCAEGYRIYLELSDLSETSHIPGLDKRLSSMLDWVDACKALRDREAELRAAAEQFDSTQGRVPPFGDEDWKRRRQEHIRRATRPAPKAKRRAPRRRRIQ